LSVGYSLLTFFPDYSDNTNRDIKCLHVALAL